MQLLHKKQYLELHPIAHLFSFPIEDYVQIHQYERGEWIIQEGTPPNYLFYVLEGAAKIYMTHKNGKTSLLNFISPFDFIGEMELLHQPYYSKGIQTSMQTICIAIPFRYREQLLNDPVFLKYLCLFLSNKTTKMSVKYSTSLAFPLENRLADFILHTAHEGVYTEKHVIVCDYLGVSYRHLLHTLSKFCEQGLLEKQRRQYIIKNPEALSSLAIALKHT